jgi:hypothetical protein
MFPRYATWERLLGDRIDHSSFETGLMGIPFAAQPAARAAARTAEVVAPETLRNAWIIWCDVAAVWRLNALGPECD